MNDESSTRILPNRDDQLPFDHVGRYQVKSVIGRGGMATVYHAYDPSFERDVAIKVLPSIYLHDPQFRTRFEREAKMIALLEHPAIVPVYDFGEQDGQPYIVMRYMAGGSLADHLKQGAISFEETIRIISRMAPALDAAHARGIIHRDLKPGNILFDQYGNAFLSDFGIARLTQQDSMTLTGEAVLGTPTYMSPEQVQGDKKLDGRSDLYALGVLVFQMLTGHVPYKADTPAKVMMMHLIEPVPNILEINNDLPETVDNVIHKAMAKEPEARFATTGELAASLEQASMGVKQPQYDRAFDQGSMGAASTSDATRLAGKYSTAATVVAPQKAASAVEQVVGKAIPRRWPYIAIASILLVIVLGGGVIAVGIFLFGRPGGGLFTLFAPATATSLPTEILANLGTISPLQNITDTPVVTIQFPVSTTVPVTIPTQVITPTTASTGPVIGGADKIAFLNKGNLWLVNLDGTQLTQLTEDGTTKTNLQWTLDGKSINYILGKCVQSVEIDTGRINNILCFNFVDYFRSFEVSPDGKKVAISLDNKLYIVPYDLEKLNQVKIRSDLTEIAECKELAPYELNFVKNVRWSLDGKTIAAIAIGMSTFDFRADVIRVYDISTCTKTPHISDQFPAPSRFFMKDYEKNPQIQNFSWDGQFLFALNSVIRNDGFGDLYVYNMDLKKARQAINPIENACCYRDPQWSPDGSHLLFAFQSLREGPGAPTVLYYVHYGTIGTGLTYTPLPLPPIAEPKAKPQPILRPAQ